MASQRLRIVGTGDREQILSEAFRSKHKNRGVQRMVQSAPNPFGLMMSPAWPYRFIVTRVTGSIFHLLFIRIEFTRHPKHYDSLLTSCFKVVVNERTIWELIGIRC
jgi:hypothetical protein